MALVELLGDDSEWYVQLAVVWHWYLPLCINTFFVYVASVCFLKPFFFKLVLINQMKWLMIPACPSLCAFFLTRAILKG